MTTTKCWLLERFAQSFRNHSIAEKCGPWWKTHNIKGEVRHESFDQIPNAQLLVGHEDNDRLADRGATRAKDAQGTPTQSHASPSILVYEDRISQVAISTDMKVC